MNTTPRNWTATLSAPDPVKPKRIPCASRSLDPDPSVDVPSGFSIGDTATMGEMLRGMRLRAGLTRWELAERLGMCARTVTRRERNLQVPRLTEIEDWAHVCGFVARVEVWR